MSSDFDILYQIQKLLMSRFQVYQFQIKFVMLSHAANVIWVQTSHHQVRKQLVLGKIARLVTIAKEWPQMKLVTTKVMPSFLCIFNEPIFTSNFFTIQKLSVFFATNDEPLKLFLSNSHMEPSLSNGWGCMSEIGVTKSCWIMTLRSWVCFDAWFLLLIWHETDQIRFGPFQPGP